MQNDKLKDFIDSHRNEFDRAEPASDLFIKIESNMTFAQPVAASAAKSLSLFKTLAIGLSAVAAVVISVPAFKSLNRKEKEKPVSVSAPKPSSASSSPSSAAATPTIILPKQTTDPVSELVPPSDDFQPSDPRITEENLPLLSAPIATSPKASHEKVVVIRSNSIDVEVVGTDVQEPVVSGVPTDNNPESTVNFSKSETDSSYEISVTCKPHKRKKGGVIEGYTGILSVQVPRNSILKVSCSFGEVKVSNIQSKRISLSVNSGDLTVSKIVGDLTASETFGEFKLTDFVGNLKASVSSGSASLTNLKGDVKLSTTFGNQRLTNVEGDLSLSCSSGSVHLTKVTGNAKVSATFGTVSLDEYTGMPSITVSSGSVNGKSVHLTGETSITATFGSVNMYLLNAMEELSFDLRATFGSLQIDKGGQKLSGESTLSHKGGPIKIRATTSSGSQSYK